MRRGASPCPRPDPRSPRWRGPHGRWRVASLSAPLICSTMNGQVSWQSEWMKVRITTCPRYWERRDEPAVLIAQREVRRRAGSGAGSARRRRSEAAAASLTATRPTSAAQRRSPPASATSTTASARWRTSASRSSRIRILAGPGASGDPRENGPMSEGDELAQSAGSGGHRRRVLDAIAARPARTLPSSPRARAGLRERRPPDRLRPDDLAAARRRPDAPGARAAA